MHVASDANRRQYKNAICMEIFYVVIYTGILYLSYWQPLQLAGRARIPLIPAHSVSKTRVNALVLGKASRGYALADALGEHGVQNRRPSVFQFKGAIKWLSPDPPQTNPKYLATAWRSC